MTTINKRNATIDIAKGIVIILMCIGHSGCPKFFHQWIYMFHMPFFFMMSGYFFSPKSLDSPLQFTVKRVKGIYIPFVTWGIIFVLLHNFFLKVGMLSAQAGEYTIKDMLWRGLTTNTRFIPTEEMMGPYWFLSELFYVSIFSFAVFFVARWLCRQTDRQTDRNFNYISASLFVALYIIGFLIKEYLPDVNSRIYRTPIVALLFFMGYLWRQYSDKIKYNIPILIIPILILTFAQYLGLADISMSDSNYGSPIRLIVYALCGAYITLYISTLFNEINWVRRALSYVGENTLIILILNVFCLRLTHLVTFYLRSNATIDTPMGMRQVNTEWYWWIVYTIIMVILPLGLKWIYNKFVIKIKTACVLSSQ